MAKILDEIVGSGQRERNGRLKKAREDFGFFCRYYLSDYFFEDPAEYQSVLYEVANTRSITSALAEKINKFVREKYRNLVAVEEKLSGAMFIEPREHGKTVRWSFAYAMWCALTGRAKFVLLIGASATAASENLQNIKNEIEENERIADDFGEMQGAAWKNDRIDFANGARIQSKGSGESMRGVRHRQYRPDLIILDDILKDDEAESYTQRNKIYRWLKKVVLNLGKNAFIVWVNTIFHNDDPISRMCAELAQGTLKRWAAVRLSCLLEDGNPLWPEYWSKEELEEKRQTIGFSAFSTEYMNEPLSDEERIVRPEWIESNKYSQLPPRSDLRFYGGVDPATGKHDMTAIVPIAVHKTAGTIYVLPPFGKTVSENETVNRMVGYYQLYQQALIGWEDVVFSGMYGKYIQKLAAEQHIYLPIKLLKVGHLSKEARIRSMTIMFETGIIRFPEKGAKNIIQQLTEFPMGAFDDLCDGLYLAVKTAECGGSGQVAATTRGKVRQTARNIISRARMR